MGVIENACQACAFPDETDIDENLMENCRNSWNEVDRAFFFDMIEKKCEKEREEDHPLFEFCDKCSEVTEEEEDQVEECWGMWEELKEDKDEEKKKNGDGKKNKKKKGKKKGNGKKDKKSDK